jgi:hypothetical protein
MEYEGTRGLRWISGRQMQDGLLTEKSCCARIMMETSIE